MKAEFLIAAIAGIPIFLFLSPFIQFLVLAGALALFVLRKPVPISHPLRSVPYGIQKDGEDIPRRNAQIRTLLRSVDDCETVPQLLSSSLGTYANKPFMGYRKLIREEKEERTITSKGQKKTQTFTIPVLEDYKWMTYKEVGTQIDKIAAGLLKTGLKPKSRISIFASTRSEWMMSALAALSQNIAVVTVYASLGPKALVYGWNETHISHVITEAELFPKVLEAAQELKDLKCVIHFDTITPDQKKKAEEQKLKVYSFEELLGLSSEKAPCADPPTPEDLAIIMYTSGTTGNPKGVMATHKNFISLVAAVHAYFNDELHPYIKEDPVYLAYLPLAHILEVACEVAMLARGGCIGYSSPRRLMDTDVKNADGKHVGDITALRPTWMAAVPVILDKIRTGILTKVEHAGVVASTLFKIAYYLKRKNYLEGEDGSFWDKVVFGKVQANFGGRLRFILSGGAPLAPQTQEFFNVVMGIPVIQGYGLTETCAGATISHPNDRTYGRVGYPIASAEIKLVDCPDLGYTSRDTDDAGHSTPRGEICIRGGVVSKGYYENKEQTDEVFKEDKEGGVWFYTGDIGVWHPDGTLQIVDRKKDLVKLKHGEYIALGKLENAYRTSEYVENIAVHVNPNKSSPVAIIVPREAKIVAFAKSQNIPVGELSELYSDKNVIAEVRSNLNKVADKEGLHKSEQLGDFVITSNVWSAENGLLTDALKLKRREAYEAHKKDLDAMYQKMSDD